MLFRNLLRKGEKKDWSVIRANGLRVEHHEYKYRYKFMKRVEGNLG